MNSNARFHLSTLLNKEELLKQARGRESLRDKNDTQRIFGKDISNHSGLYKELRRVTSKSINGAPKEQPRVEPRQPRKDLKPQLNPIKSPTPDINPQLVPEYSQHILKHMISRQQSTEPLTDRQIGDSLRASLVDTLVDAHLKFKLLPQTLFKTVKIIDKMISMNEVSKSRLHLLGVAAMFISAKYEEIYPPQPKSFVALSKGSTSGELIEMEGKILKLFEFNLVFATPLEYLARIALECKLVEKEHYLCQYLLELSLLDSKISRNPPHLLAVASVFLMGYLLKKTVKIDYEHYRVSEQDVKLIAKQLCLNLQSAPKSAWQMSRRKYSSFAYFQVSKLYLSPQVSDL